MPTDASSTPRALLVSRDPLIRGGLRTLLAEGQWSVAGEVDAVEQVQSAWLAFPFEAALWDAGPTPAPGAASVAAPPVVALVADESSARAILAAGLAGAVLRDASAATVCAALWAAAHGLTVSEHSFLHLRPVAELRRSGDSADFTPREREVLALLAEGLSNRTIAERLGISRHTVKFHVNALLQKLGVARRTEAVVRATRLGLVVL